MLATEAERFRSGEDGDGGNSGGPKPSSQRKRASLRPARAGTSAERSEPSRSEVSAGRSRNGAPVGPGAFEEASWDPWLLCCEPPSEGRHSPPPTVRDLGVRFGNN